MLFSDVDIKWSETEIKKKKRDSLRESINKGL